MVCSESGLTQTFILSRNEQKIEEKKKIKNIMGGVIQTSSAGALIVPSKSDIPINIILIITVKHLYTFI